MFFENYKFYVDVQYTGICVFMESIFCVIWYFSTVYNFIENKESNGIFLAMFSQCYALSIPFYVFRLYCRSNKPSKLQILPYVETGLKWGSTRHYHNLGKCYWQWTLQLAKNKWHVENHVHMHFDYFFPVLHIVQFTGQNFHTHPLEDIFTYS